MNRKKFIRTTLALSTFFVGHPAFSRNSFLSSVLRSSAENDRVLVLIELGGGNDGLNTVIPLDQYSNLVPLRRNIIIPEKKVLKLSDTHLTGFHPSLTTMAEFYNEKKLTVIQGVGCQHPNYSHFIAIDGKLTASDDEVHPGTGWLGRYINSVLPDFPNGYPSASYPDPAIIRSKYISSKVCIGTTDDVSIVVNYLEEIERILTLENQKKYKAGNDNTGLAFVNYVGNQIEIYAPTLHAAASKQPTLSKLYPKGKTNPLADQLQNVARLIGGGLKTKLYLVRMDKFDTHSSQVDPADTTKGVHANILKLLDEAMMAFQDDLRLMGISDRVLSMTYSDFGRRIASNGSNGTDHGNSEPVFIFGDDLKGGLVGTNPQIPKVINEQNENVEMQHDFRSVYATVLKGWFGASDSQIEASLLKNYPILDIFK